MPVFITQKTCRNADKIQLSADGRTFVVKKIVVKDKVVNGKVIGKHSPRIEKTTYPATDYNKRIIFGNYGRWERL